MFFSEEKNQKTFASRSYSLVGRAQEGEAAQR
jgi:hypothetical protein